MNTEISPNLNQQKCIDNLEGQIMVLAGPGTGKTFTIIKRIENILRSGCLPEKILCLTFSDAAAGEMQQRLVKEIGICASCVNVYTYHSFCNDIIKQHPEQFELMNDVELVDETRKRTFVKEAIDETNPVFYRTKFGDAYFFINEILDRINLIKKNRVTKQQYFDSINTNPDWQPRLISMIAEQKQKELAGKSTTTLQKNIETLKTKIGKAKELWSIYELFERKMFENSLIDFNDMINLVLEAFENDADFTKTVANKYQYVLVDEYQDTNASQNAIVFALIDGSDTKNVFVVGDDDQIIYGFQGANLDSIETFLKRYPDTQVITLNENNRSTQTILDFSHKVIEQDSTRLEINPAFSKYEISKVLTARNTNVIAKDKNIRLYSFGELLQEHHFIADDIEKLINSDNCPVNDEGEKALFEIAVICRKNADLIPYVERLRAKNIPYQITQGKSIFAIQSSLVAYFYLKALQNNELYSDKLFSLLRFGPLEIDVQDYNFLIVQNKLNHKDFISNIMENSEYNWNDKEKIDSFINTYNSLKSYASCENLKNTIIKVLNDTGLLNYYHNKEQNKLENIMALQKLIDEASNLMKTKGGASLGEYISYLDNAFNNNIAICIDDNGLKKNAVQLLTYHASKGREFEYVYLPELTQKNWEKAKEQNNLSVPTSAPVDDITKTLIKRAEELKLLFVGITRAKHGLFLSFSKNLAKKPQALTSYIASINFDGIDRQDFGIDEYTLTALFAMSIKQAEPDYKSRFNDEIKAAIKDFKFSPTALNCYLACPKRFLYEHILKIEVKEQNWDVANYGTTIHSVLEQAAKQAKQNGIYPSIDEVLECFRQKMKNQTFETQTAREQYEKRGIERLKTFYPKLIQTPVENLFELEYTFDGVVGENKVKGKIDRIEKNIDGTYSLYDYKTGSAKPKSQIKDGSDYEGYLNQLRFYKLAFESQNPDFKVSQVGLIFVEEPEQNFYTVLTDDDNKNIEQKLIYACEQLNTMNFEKNETEKSCKFCAYKQLCSSQTI